MDSRRAAPYFLLYNEEDLREAQGSREFGLPVLALQLISQNSVATPGINQVMKKKKKKKK